MLDWRGSTSTRITGIRVLLLSLYELGRQPFGLASPAAWLAEAGMRVRCLDLAVEPVDEAAVRDADVIGIHLPMHTATRLATELVPRLRRLAPAARLLFFGLYAPMNEGLLRDLGADAIIGGEFEAGLVECVSSLDAAGAGGHAEVQVSVSLDRQRFLVPDRSTLPALDRYAHLAEGDSRRVAGYTEATRGCKHRCRHCPIVPVYNGTFRVVQSDVVLADIEQQVAAGATHITFGDPDFFNGPEHGLRIVRAMHERFPELTYDVTIKVEHLLAQRRHLAELRDTGCLFVTSAVESVDDRILEHLDKGHTRADFVEMVPLLRTTGLRLNPTFVTFTPWTTVSGYVDLLASIAELGLIDEVAPIQYAIRLLIPAGSRLLELGEIRDLVAPFDDQLLCHPWEHPEPAVDELFDDVVRIVADGGRNGATRQAVFERIGARALDAQDALLRSRLQMRAQTATSGAVPHMTEDWYC